jgi:hypothetical protein
VFLATRLPHPESFFGSRSRLLLGGSIEPSFSNASAALCVSSAPPPTALASRPWASRSR